MARLRPGGAERAHRARGKRGRDRRGSGRRRRRGRGTVSAWSPSGRPRTLVLGARARARAEPGRLLRGDGARRDPPKQTAAVASRVFQRHTDAPVVVMLQRKHPEAASQSAGSTFRLNAAAGARRLRSRNALAFVAAFALILIYASRRWLVRRRGARAARARDLALLGLGIACGLLPRARPVRRSAAAARRAARVRRLDRAQPALDEQLRAHDSRRSHRTLDYLGLAALLLRDLRSLDLALRRCRARRRGADRLRDRRRQPACALGVRARSRRRGAPYRPDELPVRVLERGCARGVRCARVRAGVERARRPPRARVALAFVPVAYLARSRT